jgi:hypothetical protein
MATYYWVGGTGTWNASSTTNWAASSGAGGGAGFPTSADDVIFDNNSNTGTGAFTVSAISASCNNISFGTGASALDGLMTLAVTTLSIFGNCTLSPTNLQIFNSTVTFAATTTGKTITTNGVSFASAVTFNGVGGGWTLQDNFTTAEAFTLTNGSLDTNNQTVTCKTFNSSNSNTRTLTLGTSTVNVSGTGIVWNVSSTTGLLTLTKVSGSFTLISLGSTIYEALGFVVGTN